MSATQLYRKRGTITIVHQVGQLTLRQTNFGDRTTPSRLVWARPQGTLMHAT